ncbi:hypothetical protein BDZ89DRAFT_1092694 [Hymenopellis radicata]|nr:hypothetical protein BDZ89DRAFT_1092694 [Hymenopellis radicata]
MLDFALFLSLVPLFALAQDGGITGPTTSVQAAAYSCDASTCQLPNCHCASTDPPGGLDPSETPMFIVFTADDAIQSYTLNAVNQFLAHRENPNGCQPKITYYTSLNYTNYTLVTDWYVAGNEIADHTMTHQGDPSVDEIHGNLIALNALAGIPLASIRGFRAPYLNYSVDTLKRLAAAGFTYDSSSSASIPVTADNSDAFWPYTLDHGMANNCLRVEGTCKGEPKLPGFWEVPMYAFFDQLGEAGPHLMDPWLDAANGAAAANDTATFEYMQATFTAHYEGKRQPIGLYTHPIHLAADYPGVRSPNSTIRMINAFLDWAQEQQNVWIVSTEQLLAWVRNPTPVAQLDSLEALHCSTPDYGCPQTTPTPDNPNPQQVVPDGQQARFRLPGNCSTPFWDPINGQCICSSQTCAFQDNSRPIGPNGANLTGGGTGGVFEPDDPDGKKKHYTPFNGPNAATAGREGVGAALAVGVVGVFVGALGVFMRA